MSKTWWIVILVIALIANWGILFLKQEFFFKTVSNMEQMLIEKDREMTELKLNEININVKYDISKLTSVEIIRLDKIKITAYNPHPSQTDSSPNTSASNRIVYEGQVAISNDLRSKYKIKNGDLVFINILNKFYIIEDNLNSRLTNQLDVFMFSHEEALKMNKESSIVIYKMARDQ